MTLPPASLPPRATGRLTSRLMWAIVIAGVALALVLALPGETVTTTYVNDLYVFLDGAYRIWNGQVPNRDFHSALGPLSFLIPAAGYGLTGSLGAAMPAGMALVVVSLSLAAAQIIGTRMRPAIGLPLAIYLLLIAAVPMNPGEGLRDLSFAMFYNRIGWAALGILAVLYLKPTAPHARQTLADAAAAAGLTLLMVYLKVSYGLLAVAFLIFMLTAPIQRRAAALALAACLVVGALVELVWGGTAGHLADLALVKEVSGDLPPLAELTQTLLRNIADVTRFLLVGSLLLVWSRSLRDLIFLLGTAAAGLLIIEQNFQVFGILAHGAVAAIGAEALARRAPPGLARGTPLLVLAILLPMSALHGAALGLHAGLAMTGQARQVALPGFRGVGLARLWSDGRYDRFVRYEESLADGARVLGSLPGAERVLVLDFVGPFSAGLGLVPPRGDSPWHHWGRTLDDEHHPPADELLADVSVVMDPKEPVEFWTAQGMRDLYAPTLQEGFVLYADTEFWRVYLAREAVSETAALRPDVTRIPRQSTSAQP